MFQTESSGNYIIISHVAITQEAHPNTCSDATKSWGFTNAIIARGVNYMSGFSPFLWLSDFDGACRNHFDRCDLFFQIYLVFQFCQLQLWRSNVRWMAMAQRSAKDWLDRFSRAAADARIACYRNQVIDFALFNLESEDAPFPAGWKPATHPFQCGCTGFGVTSPPSSARCEGARCMLVILIVSCRLSVSNDDKTTLSGGAPTSGGAGLKATAAPTSGGAGLKATAAPTSGGARVCKRKSRSHPERAGVARSQAECPRKIRKFVDIDNAELVTELEYTKGDEVRAWFCFDALTHWLGACHQSLQCSGWDLQNLGPVHLRAEAICPSC
jgi:hypothetical protein